MDGADGMDGVILSGTVVSVGEASTQAGASVGADGIIPGGDPATTVPGGTEAASDGATPDGVMEVIGAGATRIMDMVVTTRIMVTIIDMPIIVAAEDTTTTVWPQIVYVDVLISLRDRATVMYVIEVIAGVPM